MKIAVSLNFKSDKTLKIKSNKTSAMYSMIGAFCLTCLLIYGCEMPKSSLDKPKPTEFFVDQSLENSNMITSSTTVETIKSMRKLTETEPNLTSIYQAANTTQNKIKVLVDLIAKLRFDIIEASGGIYSLAASEKKWSELGYSKITITNENELDGVPVDCNNTNAPKTILLDKKKGENLKVEIIKANTELVKVIENLIKELEPAEAIKFEKLIEPLKKEIVLKVPNEYGWRKAGFDSWSSSMFNNSTVASSLLLLRKFEHDAINSVAQVVNLLQSNMGEKVLFYDKFDIYAQPKKGHILLGETFEAEIALGAYTSQSEFSVSVNGSNVAVDNAKANYKFKPTTIGNQRYAVTINIKNPLTGKIETVKKEFEYEVISPVK